MEASRGVLTDEEVSVISAIIRSAYAEPLATGVWSEIMDRIALVVPHDIGCATFTNVYTGQIEDAIYRNADEEAKRWYREEQSAMAVIGQTAEARGLSVWHPADVLGKVEWEQCDMRRELLGFGLDGPICVTCVAGGEISARLCFVRRAGSPEFSAKDYFILNLLQPHFCEALRLAGDMLRGSVSRAYFEQSRLPQFVVDPSYRIVDMNSQATRMVEGESRDALLARVREIAREMVEAEAHMRRLSFAGEKPRWWRTTVQPPESPTLHIMAVDGGWGMRRLMKDSMIDAGFTDREIGICAMMVEGASNQEIAEKLFIAESTVKDHVTSILDKLGVQQRSGITKKLLGY